MLMNKLITNDLEKQLLLTFGEARSNELFNTYSHAFPTSYWEDCSIDVAINDISHLEKINSSLPLDVHFYLTPLNALHLRVYQFENPIPLSDMLPMLENMGLRALNDRTYEILLPTSTIWISDFTVSSLQKQEIEIESVKEKFKESFINTHHGIAENDGFNRLVLGAHLSWKEIVILRAYAKYLRQIGFRFTQSYIEHALANNPSIAKDLVKLFITKFNPTLGVDVEDEYVEIQNNIFQVLETVTSLDEDLIIRSLLAVINATLRTNYFQKTADGLSKSYLSFKIQSSHVPQMPLPMPLFEIFVYSPRFEGIHLRSTKVARGGIRWSDRREDFRTEILGLMKAQKVKNAIIVPSGAKGGFVLKNLPTIPNREILQQEVIYCYKHFIRGLLDLTDNLKDKEIIPPQDVVCYDEPDTYLVVAADKGTASFSDIANSISKEYNFWLGDAFASGGSAGYDHKKMGITARGCWESIKRHFHELNVDVENTDFTVVGIGDMGGDVFGNGMLYTPHIKLIAAFDHRHIFLDPNPDSMISYKERTRLFNLPASSWEDYDPKLISTGGGVFKRASKSIPLSPEIKHALNIEADSMTPNDLIRAILKAPVDLLYNGGIGTYVKASSESHADVGDKTNEYCRINACELHCKVVGEGGNLGFTQLGRIEFALQGGLINTDFIDNSAGVDCSDHEVNIKILLNQEVIKGRISEEKRNEILTSMTQEVSDLVLSDNYNQALVMSVASFYTNEFIGLQTNYIKDLEAAGIINRAVEFLPDDRKLNERKAAGLGLTRPELAVLLAYTKIHIKNDILDSDIPEQSFLSKNLTTAFPPSLEKLYPEEMAKHTLRREIIATQISNQIINEMGITFVYNLQVETGATVPEIIRAYFVASKVFDNVELQQLIESFEFKLPLSTQYELLNHIRRLIYLSTRWFLRNQSLTDDSMQELTNHYSKCVKEIEKLLPTLMGGFTKHYLESLLEQFNKAGIATETARRIAVTRALYTSLNIIQVANQHKFNLESTAKMYFAVGEKFNLLWFRDKLANDRREGYWETLARLTLRDELDILQKQITYLILRNCPEGCDTQTAIQQWVEKHPRSISRWTKIRELLYSSPNPDNTMFFIALREMHNLISAEHN